VKPFFAEYETITESVMDPRLVASFGVNPLRDSWERHQFAFAGPKRLFAVTRPGVMAYSVPPTEVVPATGMPPDVARRMEESRRIAVANEQGSGVASWFLGSSKDLGRSRSVFDGADAYLQLAGLRQAVKADAALFVSDPVYLVGLGLRPADPKPQVDVRKGQERLWYPANFTSYNEAGLRPQMEVVDGSECVVVDASWDAEAGGLKKRLAETLWLDPALNCAPRWWEVRESGVLVERRTNAWFEEFAPGCWLPWEVTVEFGPPAWVPKEYHDKPVYRNLIRLRRAVVNDAKEEWFRPDSGSEGS
jgi:hypothetical protein